MDIPTYLDALQASMSFDPETASTLELAKEQYRRKWWHELSQSLLKIVRHPNVRSITPDIHKCILMQIRLEISPETYVKLLYVTVAVLSAQPKTEEEDPRADALGILEGAGAAMLGQGNQQMFHSIQAIRALLLLVDGPSVEAKRLLDKVAEHVDTLQTHEVESVLHAFLAKGRARLHELSGNYTDFYKTAFDMVTYSDAAGIPVDQTELDAIAYKVAIAALLSPSLHNFGRLLTYPRFIDCLSAGRDAWLVSLVRQCNSGDVLAFEQTLLQTAVQQSGDLGVAVSRLKQKVRLMALLHLLFHTPASARTFTFDQLAGRCMVDVGNVELLLLNALALHLIEGTIDGLAGTIEITWVYPRVMEPDDISALARRVKEWRAVVKQTACDVEKAAKDAQLHQ